MLSKSISIITHLSVAALAILATANAGKATTLGIQWLKASTPNNGQQAIPITAFFGTPNPNVKTQTNSFLGITPTGNPASSNLIPAGTTYNPLDPLYTNSQNPGNDFACIQPTTAGCTPIPQLGTAFPQTYQQKFLLVNNTSFNITGILETVVPANPNDPITGAVEQLSGYKDNPNFSFVGVNGSPSGSASDIFSNLQISTTATNQPTLSFSGGAIAPGQYFTFFRNFNNLDANYPYEKIVRGLTYTAVPEPSSTLSIFTLGALGTVTLLKHRTGKIKAKS